jgi:hypothetical protein
VTDAASSSSSGQLPSGFDPDFINREEEEWLSQAYDNALENILRSSGIVAPPFPTSQADDYHPPSYVVPCPTSEPQEVVHFQQDGQGYVDLDVSHL